MYDVADAPFAFDAALSAIQLVDTLVQHAHKSRASDIHLDPHKDALRVRMRVDGYLRETHVVPKKQHEEVIARIKILAGLRTDEHHAGHDGRFATEIDGTAIDVRVSIVPTYHGENCVMRLLSDAAQDFTLARLGCTHAQREIIANALRSPHGMILVTGPTGSGKTTTLYTMLKMLNKCEVSIVSIEDPIEYAIAGITQIPVGLGSGMNFASGLRSVVRQDPDVIMVGEIRDGETAALATNAALTGHLVLSTLHTNDAVTALPRLLEMGVEPYLIASTLRLVIGQRLVRRVCAKCKTPHKVTTTQKAAFESLVSEDVYRSCCTQYIGRGCTDCAGTGFSGRIVVQEMVAIDNDLREAIVRKSSADALHRLACEKGMVPLMTDGLAKVREGITTLEEVLRMRYE